MSTPTPAQIAQFEADEREAEAFIEAEYAAVDAWFREEWPHVDLTDEARGVARSAWVERARREPPPFRGYALLGAGAYLLTVCDGDERGPELVFELATEEQKIGRTVGDLGDVVKGAAIPLERTAIRLQFASHEGLRALEQQLAFVRDELDKRFAPEAAPVPRQAAQADEALLRQAVEALQGVELIASFAAWKRGDALPFQNDKITAVLAALSARLADSAIKESQP